MVSADDAIRKGKKMLVYPTMLIVFLNLIMAFIFASNEFPKWVFIFFFVAAPILGWLYWSFYAPKWRIWAFENVRNVHELKRKAVRHKLLHNDADFSRKTMFVSADQKLQLEKIEKKFLIKDAYNEDLSVTIETQIFFAQHAIAGAYFFSSAVVILGIYVSVSTDSLRPLWLFLPIGGFLLYKAHKRYGAKTPQLVINAIGIRVADETLIEWANIAATAIDTRREGKHDNHYLVISYYNRYEEVCINDLDISLHDLEHCLQVHRFRFEKTLS
jgi:hypothetical protein